MGAFSAFVSPLTCIRPSLRVPLQLEEEVRSREDADAVASSAHTALASKVDELEHTRTHLEGQVASLRQQLEGEQRHRTSCTAELEQKLRDQGATSPCPSLPLALAPQRPFA